MNLRQRIANSALFNNTVEAILAQYMRFAYATSRWERDGFEDMEAELDKGEPVIFCVWHQRLVMAPFMFDQTKGKFCSLTSSARAGRLVGNTFARFGFDTVPMSSHIRHVALSREVLNRIRSGFTVGIAVDGPRGPARVASTVPLIWTRSSGKKVFVLSWSANRVITLPLWDKCRLPVPFSRGILMCQRWDQTVARKLTDDQTEALRIDLEAALNKVTDQSDVSQGRGIEATPRRENITAS